MELKVSVDYEFETAFLLYCGELYELPTRDAHGLIAELRKRLGSERKTTGNNVVSHAWEVDAGTCRAVWPIVESIKGKKLISEKVWDF